MPAERPHGTSRSCRHAWSTSGCAARGSRGSSGWLSFRGDRRGLIEAAAWGTLSRTMISGSFPRRMCLGRQVSLAAPARRRSLRSVVILCGKELGPVSPVLSLRPCRERRAEPTEDRAVGIVRECDQDAARVSSTGLRPRPRERHEVADIVRDHDPLLFGGEGQDVPVRQAPESEIPVECEDIMACGP